ncbi:MAG: Gfo/Idh/MocA family oxidoreductase [Candidatus Hydrogenedentes bacterium]|nr:Gfo/Idh/MocA family oxidoreductase [Candidatus Hydrogenedentota bacterium]
MTAKKQGGITRRDFTRASAIGSFAILASQTGQAETNSGTIKIGLIGCGGRGTGAAVNCLEGNKNVKLVAMADLFEDRLKDSRTRIGKHSNPQVTSQFDVKDDMCFVGWDAYKQLLATDVDMIIHACTPYIRPVHIEAAVEAGKHIFTEKPVAVDPVGIRKFIAASEKAKEKGLNIVTGTQRRHEKPYLEEIKKIQDGSIGDIVAARAYWCGTLPFKKDRDEKWSDLEYQIRNWYAHCWVCGDNIVEQHVHNLDVICWVLGGPPVNVFASGGRAWKDNADTRYGDLWDQFSCDYEFANGVHVTSMCRHWSGDCAQGVFEHVMGTKGTSSCRDNNVKDYVDPYVQEHMDLLAAIRGEAPYINEGVQCAHSTMTAIMGRMAAYTGKKLTWEEALNADLSIVPEKLDFSLSYPVGPIPVPGSAKA